MKIEANNMLEGNNIDLNKLKQRVGDQVQSK